MRVYSTLLLATVGACSFTPGSLRSDATVTDDDAPDGMVLLDAPPDTPQPPPGNVRSIDIVDAQVAGASHANFPLLISLSSQTWLRSTGNGGDVARTDGFDIYFTSDQAGVNRLAHEVEAFDPVIGTLVAWVKVALTPQTVLYIHYGDPALMTSQEMVTTVWTGGYELVVHMAGSGDATGKSGSNTNSNLVTAIGQIDQARSFNGADSYAAVGSDTEIDNIWAGGGTAEAWFFADTYGEGSRARLFDKGDTAGWSLFVVNDGFATNSLSFVHGTTSGGGQWHGPDNSVTTGAWHHVAVNYDKGSLANNPTVLLDGAALAMTRTVAPTGAISNDDAAELYIGNNPGQSRTFDGILDEIRLSSSVRSADWLLTTYRNQSNPGAFYMVSNPL